VFNLFSNTNNESNEIKSIKFNDFIVCVKKWVFLIYSPILWGQAACFIILTIFFIAES
jgi:hypothetical protein